MAIVKYDAKTGKKLAKGATTKDALGNTFKEGTEYKPKITGSNSTTVRFDSNTGKLMAPGQTSTDAMGNIYKQGEKFMPTKFASNPLAPNEKIDPATQPIPQAPVPTQPPVNPATLLQQPVGTPAQPQTPVSPYKQGFAQTMATGTPAPGTMGQASGTIQNSLPPAAPDTSTMDAQLGQDKFFQQLLANRQAFVDVATQGDSLMSTYDKMVKKAGIPGIDKELLNTKKIIEGTEDDIRSEVQAANGFATDSQVLALANSRNKQLIKNYNNLLDTKQMAMENINTMMGLAAKDRDFAMSTIMQKMQIDEQLISYRDKFVNNAREAYNNTIKAVGYDGLLQSLQATGDPNTISVFERTMGMPQGALTIAAQQAAKARAQQLEMDNLDIRYKKAQIANMNSQISERNSGVGSTGNGGTQGSFETLEDIKNAPVSDLTKSVMAGYAKMKELTPTDRSKVAQELYKVGFNPQQYVLRKLDTLAQKWDSVPDNFKGLVKGRIQPFASSRNAEVAAFESQKQILTREIARLNDVGVLSDQDVAAYKAAMPGRGDANREVVDAKISGVRGALGATPTGKVQGAPVVGGSTILYQGKQYTVDAKGDMHPL